MKKFFFLFGFVVLLLAGRGIVFSQSPPTDSAPDEVLVKLKDSVAADKHENIHRTHKVTLKTRLDKLNVDVVAVEKGKVAEKVAEYQKDPNVEYAEPNYVARAFELTNDPYLPNQWGMYKVKAADASTSAWTTAKSDPSVKIAILDTGIDQDHPDLASKIVSQKNCTTSPTLDDLYGHGTHVAGIAAAATNNGAGVAGLGYNASLVNAKGLGDDGSGYYSWLANCIVWAADSGVKVINMSLGGSGKSQTLQNAVNYAWGKNVVLVAAAGNSGNSAPSYPAYYTNVIAVAATDQNDKKASWSSYGKWVDVAAPGVGIYSTLPNHT
ncbi:MAG: S8 family serine peptidase, partial [Patescibacteria group bacterium]